MNLGKLRLEGTVLAMESLAVIVVAALVVDWRM